MKQSNLITALVVSGMSTQWSRHYLRSAGFSKMQTEAILLATAERMIVTGNILYCRFILDSV